MGKLRYRAVKSLAQRHTANVFTIGAGLSDQTQVSFYFTLKSPLPLPPPLRDPCLPLLSLPSYHKSNMYLLYTQNYFISQNENISNMFVLCVLTNS